MAGGRRRRRSAAWVAVLAAAVVTERAWAAGGARPFNDDPPLQPVVGERPPPSTAAEHGAALQGGTARALLESCPSTGCYDYNCDYWASVNNDYTCEVMESAYSCDCTGCQCDNDPPTVSPTTTPVPTSSPAPTTACHPYEHCATAASQDDIEAALASLPAGGSLQIDVTRLIIMSSEIQIVGGVTVSFTSSSGLGELSGGGEGRVMVLGGTGTRVRLEGIRVGDGRARNTDGGCILVMGGGALELDGAEVSGCSAVQLGSQAEETVSGGSRRACAGARRAGYQYARAETSLVAPCTSPPPSPALLTSSAAPYSSRTGA